MQRKLYLDRPNQFPRLNNVVMDSHVIPVSVTRHFTDVNGIILPITDPLIIAAGLDKKFPYFLFGEFDRAGGYATALKTCEPVAGEFLCSFVNKSPYNTFNILGFTGLNQIKDVIRTGDIVQVYTDSIQSPNYFVWIVISNSYTALGSIVSNLQSEQRDNRNGKLYIKGVNFYYNTLRQLDEALHFTIMDNIGTFRDDSINPTMFRGIFTAQDNLVELETDFTLNQFIGLNSYITVTTNTISFDFLIHNIKQ
jgi:hypothetical protein